MRNILIIFLFLATASAQTASLAAGGSFWPNRKAHRWAEKQLALMSTEEKIGQMIHIGVNARFANRENRFFKELLRQVTENKIGGVIFFGAPIYETTILANRMQEAAKIPLLFSLDAETGIGMRFEDAENFPWAMAVAATGDPELARKMGEIAGREARAVGIRHIYAPVLDVNNNAANPVINVRSFGEDPEQVARFGTAFALGVQSSGVIATAKHFPGHGDTNVDSHRGLPVIDLPRERLDRVELLPFRRAVQAGIGSIMIGHIALPQIDNEIIRPLREYKGGDAEPGAEIITESATIPATLSNKIQTGILRNEFGFKGLIVSDAMSMSGLTLYFTQEEAGVRAVLAGIDILEKPADPDAMIRGLKDAVASGRIPLSRLDDAVLRQLEWKYAVGLAKDKITSVNELDRIVSGPDSASLAAEIATKAITLVRNDNNALPLRGTRQVAVIGISNGFDGPATIAPFANALRIGGLRFSQAYLQENSLSAQIQSARKAIEDADTIVFGLYGRVRSGASNSVGIPENGAALLREALAAGKNVIGISFGNPYIITSFPEIRSYLVAYGDMPSLQQAAALALLGRRDITGRLPISLPGLYPRGSGIDLPATK